MHSGSYDCLIVGSGAGGATLAKELVGKGKDVLVVEKGRRQEKVGTFRDALRYYDVTSLKIPRKSKEGVILWGIYGRFLWLRNSMPGGRTH